MEPTKRSNTPEFRALVAARFPGEALDGPPLRKVRLSGLAIDSDGSTAFFVHIREGDSIQISNVKGQLQIVSDAEVKVHAVDPGSSRTTPKRQLPALSGPEREHEERAPRESVNGSRKERQPATKKVAHG